jgi:hypothetical protein
MGSQRPLLVGNGGAIFSPDDRYRYALWRLWDEDKGVLCIIGLNPSTADAVNNDPTVERCQRRARMMGYGGLRMANIFAYRATDPKRMLAAPDPVGPENDAAILQAAKDSALVVCAWGAHGAHLDRGRAVAKMLREAGVELYCLGVTDGGQPFHPLYIPYVTLPRPWEGLP